MNEAYHDNLCGEWQLVVEDDSFELGHSAFLEIFPDGRLDYHIDHDGEVVTYSMIYRIEGGSLLAHEPEDKSQVRLTCWITSTGVLALQRSGQTSYYARVD